MDSRIIERKKKNVTVVDLESWDHDFPKIFLKFFVLKVFLENILFELLQHVLFLRLKPVDK